MRLWFNSSVKFPIVRHYGQGGTCVAEFWADWGALAYLAAAAWAFFEGETFVILASAAGHATGLIDPWILMVSVWIGSFLGDQLWFTLRRAFLSMVRQACCTTDLCLLLLVYLEPR